MHAERNFGRRYVVAWDDEVARYHVTLGRDSIGFHKTREGAKAVAREHAARVSIADWAKTYSVIFVERSGGSVA